MSDVVYDTKAAPGYTDTSPFSFNITLGEGDNGAVALLIEMTNNALELGTVTVGGLTASPVALADTQTAGANRTLIYVVPTGSASGVQAVSIPWTGAGYVGCIAVAVKNADQDTPMDFGDSVASLVDPDSVAYIDLDGDDGDMTVSHSFFSGSGAITTDQTEIDAAFGTSKGARARSSGDMTRHTWSRTPPDNSDILISGATFIQAGGGAPGATESFQTVLIKAAP